MIAVYVAFAGAAGVLARYAISSPFHGATLPWITVAINVVGSYLLGILVVAHWATPEVRTALGVGFLGGFTTFSTFSVQAWLDIEAGRTGTAALYVAASVVLGIAAAAAGYATGKAL